MMENLLSEGRYDKVTTDLSREIVQAVKQGKKRLQTRITLFKRTNIEISVYFHYSDESEPEVYGAMYPKASEIRKHYKGMKIIYHVVVPLDRERRMQGLSDIIPEIKNIVRHEIEHVTQSKFKEKERAGFFSNKRRYPEDIEYWEYLTEPYEVEAYVRGLYKKAKTVRQPLNVLLNAWWDYLRSVDLDPPEIEAVKRAWTGYAAKHLPRTPLRQFGYEEDNAGYGMNVTDAPPVRVDLTDPNINREEISESLLFEAKKDTLRSKYNSIPDEFFNMIVDGDPSPTKKYSEWMLKQYSPIPAEIEKLIDVVNRFDRSVNRINHEFIRKGIDQFESEIGMDIPMRDIDAILRSPKDINSYAGFSILNAILNQIESKKTKREEKMVGAEKIYEDENFLVVLPKTPEGSCHYGSGTRWCVAARDGNQFNNYSRRGTLYYIIFKANSVLDPERRNKDVWKRRLPVYEKIARFIPNGLDYGAHGEFYDAQDRQIEEDTILNGFFGVTWNYLQGLGEHIQSVPKGTQPFYDSFYKAWTRIDTHYAKNGMQKHEPSPEDYYNDMDDWGEDINWDDDDI